MVSIETFFRENILRSAVVIVNYNGADLLKQQLPNFEKFLPVGDSSTQFILIDNNSVDRSLEVATSFKWLKVVKFYKNYFFLGAANRVIKELDCDFVFLFNNDVFFTEFDFKDMVEVLKNPSVFAVGATLYKPDGGFLVGARVGEYSHGILKVKNLPIEKHLTLTPTLFVTGGAIAFRKFVFEKLGGFDPIYLPGYWEDTDLCFRAWGRGFVSFICRDWKMIHLDKATMKPKLGNRLSLITARNSFIFTWKNLPNLGLQFFNQFYKNIAACFNGNTRFIRAQFLAFLRWASFGFPRSPVDFSNLAESVFRFTPVNSSAK